MIEQDLHGYSVKNAIDRIFYCMRKAIINGHEKIHLIHGYNRGTRIRDYLDSSEFKEDCKTEGMEIKSISRYKNKGDTLIKMVLPPSMVLPDFPDVWSKLELLKKYGKLTL